MNGTDEATEVSGTSEVEMELDIVPLQDGQTVEVVVVNKVDFVVSTDTDGFPGIVREEVVVDSMELLREVVSVLEEREVKEDDEDII